jgi:cyclase
MHFEGIRVIGDAHSYANKYYLDNADEIIYIDSVASLYGRNISIDHLKRTVDNIFIPVTVGGGIRSVKDIENVLNAGGDKVAINSAAIRSPELISDAVRIFGSQCIVGSIQTKQINSSSWEALIDGGRQKTGVNVVEWSKILVDLGVGEILLTSVDKSGVKKGYDTEIVKQVSTSVSVPIIASGGEGSIDDIIDVVIHGAVDAVAIASVLHFDFLSITRIKELMQHNGIDIRF